MPMRDFMGQTFVAFTDIAGFKSMMKDARRGPEALDALYSAGYRVIADQGSDPRVEGLFVSDCGILFAREMSCIEQFEALLRVIEQLNRLCFERAVSLTTSVAWGDFSYHGRVEIPGIEKNPIYGNAYVAAFIDNESESPKMYANECRIARQNLPPKIGDLLEARRGPIDSRCRAIDRHFYFEWMRPGHEDAREQAGRCR
jgi:hypothetical protein